uniref:Uncharacterized protein n=1 Tax=Hyaloperonospora arabidopsidis (strain Emoy2) TaxID=559515 RepID=M4C6R6_HYAAE
RSKLWSSPFDMSNPVHRTESNKYDLKVRHSTLRTITNSFTLRARNHTLTTAFHSFGHLTEVRDYTRCSYCTVLLPSARAFCAIHSRTKQFQLYCHDGS